MSANPHAAHASADHGHGHDHSHGGAPHSTLGGYITGFVLSVILTAVPFWLVMTGALGSNQATALVVVLLAAVQVVVHMVFFLHMNTRVEGGWSLMALVFTVVVVAIALSGSLWVMFHLSQNMVPVTVDSMKQLP